MLFLPLSPTTSSHSTYKKSQAAFRPRAPRPHSHPYRPQRPPQAWSGGVWGELSTKILVICLVASGMTWLPSSVNTSLKPLVAAPQIWSPGFLKNLRFGPGRRPCHHASCRQGGVGGWGEKRNGSGNIPQTAQTYLCENELFGCFSVESMDWILLPEGKLASYHVSDLLAVMSRWDWQRQVEKWAGCFLSCDCFWLVQVLLQALAFCLWSYCFVFRLRFTMALPMKKSVMKSTMKSSMKKTAMKARVMKKKAVSKIARGKLAKVVVFKGNKEGSVSKTNLVIEKHLS